MTTSTAMTSTATTRGTTGRTTSRAMAGRATAVAALAVGVVYLGWRAAETLAGTPWWLGGPTLAVEVIGLLAVAVTCWALWRRPEIAAHTVAEESLDAEVVVRCTDQTLPAVRASVLAARRLGPVFVLDLRARPEVAALAVEHGARYVATDPDDLDGIAIAAAATDASSLLVIEAGDIVHPAALRTLLPWLDEAGVAIVQGPVESSSAESAEHGAGGRHDQRFERRALVPSLGARGLGAFTGSGALLRTEAVRSVELVRSSPEMVRADLTCSLLATGWQIAAPGGSPVVAVQPIALPAEVEDVRAREASAARHLLVGPSGAWRPNRLSVAQRLALTALAVRPLAGLRRGVIVLVLLGVLLAGRLPIEADAVTFAALWTPWFVLAAVALWALSDGELRPGDRVRWGMRVLGASWRGVAAPDGRPDPAAHVLGSAFGLHHGVAPAGAVAAISVVIGLRAVSDRVTHTLAAMPLDRTATVLVVALWSLGGGLDALRILARRAQARRATRVASSLPSTFADHAALVVDLTPLGAGVLGDVELPIGSTQQLDVVVPTASGVVSASLPVIVRNVRTDFSGERRYGVEFAGAESAGGSPTMAGYVADALAEYCVVQPALDLLGARAPASTPDLAGASAGASRLVVVLADQPALPRRMGLRAAALVAVAGAMASAVPTAQADSASTAVVGRVVVADEVAVALPADPDAAPTPSSAPTDASTTVVVSAPPDTADLPPATDPAATSAPTTAAPSGSSGSSGAGTAGAVVTVVCSMAVGADGEWGTSDDIYGAPVSTVVADDGTWSLDVDGVACWATVAPPVGLMVPGETSELESPRAPLPIDLASGSFPTIELVPAVPADDRPSDGQPADDRPADEPVPAATDGVTSPSDGGTAIVIDDVIWTDLDADGAIGDGESRVPGVTVTLLDAAGVAVATVVTDDDGLFRFDGAADATYRLAVSNLPDGSVPPTWLDALGRTEPFSMAAGSDLNLSIGLRPAPTAPAAGLTGGVDLGGGVSTDGAAAGQDPPPVRLFAEPSPASFVTAAPVDGSPLGRWLVVVLATLIGVSVLAGSLRPGRPAFAPNVPRLA